MQPSKRPTASSTHLDVEAGPRIGRGDIRGGQAERGRAGGVRDEARADAQWPSIGAHHGERPGRRELNYRPRHLGRRRPRLHRGYRRGSRRCGGYHPDPAPHAGDGAEGRRRLLGEEGGGGGERGGEEGGRSRRRRHDGNWRLRFAANFRGVR